MESISRLRTALYKALSPSNIQYNEEELFDELMVQKPRLLKLLDVGQMNAQEQKEIESGVFHTLLIVKRALNTLL
jgi:nuclear pore complex protein Nup205